MTRAFSILVIAALATATGCGDDRGTHQSTARVAGGYSEAQFLRAAEQGDLSLVRACLEAGLDVDGAGDRVKRFGTPLVNAAFAGQTSVVRMLIDAGADPNKPAVPFGPTALMGASLKGDVESVRLLLSAGAMVNAVEVDGQTALMFAADGNFVECVRALIGGGADVNAKTSEESNGLRTVFGRAMDKADLPVIQVLFDASPVVANGASLLHAAVGFQREDLVQALLERGADVNARDSHGRTPIFYDHSDGMKLANVGGRTTFRSVEATMTRLLLDAGADPNVQDEYGQTVLHNASVSFHMDRIRSLIAAGADPTIPQKDGYTAAQIFKEFWKKKGDPRTWDQADHYLYETLLALLEGRDATTAGEAVLQGSYPAANALQQAAPDPPELIVKGILSSGDGAKAIVGYPASRWSSRTVQVGDIVESSGANWEVAEIDPTKESVMLTHRESGASHVITTAR